VSAVAAKSASIVGTVEPDFDAVARSTEEGSSIGVFAAPTIFRHGPVLHVEVNPAAYSGNILDRLKLIDGVLEDDGIWSLEKPKG
jgi:hypothetical protein